MTNAQNDRHAQTDGAALNAHFSRFSHATAQWTGNPTAFLLAMTAIVVWVVTGPIFHFSDTWQLVINTGTTVVTFLMVFLIQNTQNRDTLALQLKLSELVLAMKGAQNKYAAIEDLTDEELEELHEESRARLEMTAARLKSCRGGRRNDADRRRATMDRAPADARRSQRQS